MLKGVANAILDCESHSHAGSTTHVILCKDLSIHKGAPPWHPNNWKCFYLCSLTFTKIKPCCYDEMVMVLVSIVDLAAASSLALSLSERIQLVHFYRLCVAVDDNEEAGGLVY